MSPRLSAAARSEPPPACLPGGGVTPLAPEEAYEKSLDKKKFRPFLARPPEDDEG